MSSTFDAVVVSRGRWILSIKYIIYISRKIQNNNLGGPPYGAQDDTSIHYDSIRHNGDQKRDFKL